MPVPGFGALLDALIRERCRTIVAFCEAIEAAGGAKVDRGDVSRIINGSDPIRRPPKESDQLETWCRALRLSPREAKTFRLEALLTHTPGEIVEMIRSQHAREERHRKVLAGMREQIIAAEAQAANLERLIRKAD
jgi:hypothetical protein